MQGHSIHEFPQTGQKDICMAVVKYTPFVLLDGAGSQKNQHQSVVGVARGIKWVIVHRESQIKCRWWLRWPSLAPGGRSWDQAGLGWL